MSAIPIDSSTQMKHLTEDPYPIYKRYRAESPVVHVASIDRTFITKYDDCRYVKNNPDIFSSKDSSAPMERAFQAQTLMKKDGDEHQRERNAMAMAYTPKSIVDVWQSVHAEYLRQQNGTLVTDINGWGRKLWSLRFHFRALRSCAQGNE